MLTHSPILQTIEVVMPIFRKMYVFSILLKMEYAFMKPFFPLPVNLHHLIEHFSACESSASHFLYLCQSLLIYSALQKVGLAILLKHGACLCPFVSD
jgi:hypothetical protein